MSKCNKKAAEAANLYPGVDANMADGCRVDKTRVDDEVNELNNNPRNTDDIMPDGPDKWPEDDQL